MATHKRPSPSAVIGNGEHINDLGPPEKKLKASPGHESPTGYSDSVRRKLQATNRTGQACDRCKERKMRCDPNPLGCGPCRQKNLPCVTTDRVSGRPSERGHTERLEGEISALKAQLNTYIARYGSMDGKDSVSQHVPSYEPSPVIHRNYSNNTPRSQKTSLTPDFSTSNGAHRQKDGPHVGPIRGTKVDVLDLQIDVADFDCPGMDEPTQAPFLDGYHQFNNSRSAFLDSITGRTKVSRPELPERDTAITYAKYYISVIHPYTPLLHGPSFLRLAEMMYEPSFQPTTAQTVLFYVVMAIISYQMAVRNPSQAKHESEKSNRYYHFSLCQLGDLLKNTDLPGAQALAIMLIHARNFPKPGYSWALSKLVLTRIVELDYHRSASKLDHHLSQLLNPLEIELRKRVFWIVFEKVVMSGLKLGRPMPMDMYDLDIEFPEPLLDEEVSESGLMENRSGRCNFWVGLQAIRQVPLWLDMYNNIIKVRKPTNEYLQDLEMLDARLLEWKAQVDADFAKEKKDSGLEVAVFFAESWYAEYRLWLHHPHLCTSNSPDVLDKNLHVCHEASLDLLRTIQALFEKFRGADFTWHSTVAYVLAAGMSLEYYQRRKQKMTPEAFKPMQQELQDWLKVMKGAGAVLGSGDQLLRFFKPLVENCLRESQNVLIASTTLQNGHQESMQASRSNSKSTQGVPPYPQGGYPDPGINQRLTSNNARRTSIAQPVDNPTSIAHQSQNSIPSFVTQYDYAQEAQHRSATGNSSHDVQNPYVSPPSSSSNNSSSSNTHYPPISNVSPPSLPTSSSSAAAAPPPPSTKPTSMMYPAVNMSISPATTYSGSPNGTSKQEHPQQQPQHQHQHQHPASTLISLSQAGLSTSETGLGMMDDNAFNLADPPPPPPPPSTTQMWPHMFL